MPVADPSGWEIAAALGTCVGGLAAAVSAGGSLRAARASERTSREAREALAVGMEPQVRFDMHQIPLDPNAPQPSPTRLELRVLVMGHRAATELEASATYANGEQVTARREHLAPFMDSDDWLMPLRDVTADWPPHDTREPVEVVVRYSDERGVGRYEQSQTFQLEGAASVGTLAVSIGGELARHRRLR